MLKADTTWAVPNKKRADEEAAQLKDGWQRTLPTNPATAATTSTDQAWNIRRIWPGIHE